MNTLRTFFIAALFTLPFAGKSQCQASFNYSANGLTVAFNGSVSPSAPGYFYYWWFSDMGNSAFVEDPVYTFSAPGTYTVCFSVYDSLGGCNDSVCMPVTVTGSAGCTADFTVIDSAGYSYFLGSSTAGSGAQYIWDFGDGNFGSGQYPWHQYANPGTYNVCLTVYTANQQFCDSTCHTVVIQSQGGCSASFTYMDSLGYVFFFGTSTLGFGGYYMWDFGDGNYANTQNPSHIYANPGTYNVCLTVYDSNQVFCDSTCMTIVVQTSSVSENNALQNSLTVAPNPADDQIRISFDALNASDATVTLYDASGRIAEQKTLNVQRAGFVSETVNTNNLSQGIYLLKLEVNGTVAWSRVALAHQ